MRFPTFAPLRAALLAIAVCAAPLSAAVPTGFTDVTIAEVAQPTALAFTPDGRLLISQKTGALRVHQDDALLPTPAITLAGVCSESERGLLGIAVDPDFASTRHIFLYYTFLKGATCVNRVSRFTLQDTNVVDPGSELILIDNVPSPGANHNGGDVHFGKDGYLYVSIGDGGTDYAGNSGSGGSNDAARDQHILLGKIVRITKSGGIPPDNPFQGPGTARCNESPTTIGNKCQETFAWGLRNPFRIAFDPNAAGTRFFINDVGQGAWEEIDEGQAGADYGWNCREGAHPNPSAGDTCSPPPSGMVDPVYEYRHGQVIPGTTSPTNCNSITGGAFVPDGAWPGFEDAYLFGDFICGEIFVLKQVGSTLTAVDFGQGLGGVTTMIFGPHEHGQALYYTTHRNGGEVHRVSFGPFDFHTLTPCRLVDTGGGNAPHLAAGTTRSFAATGQCGIPATAGAIAVNVTVVDPASGGHLRIWPMGAPMPGTSVINFGPGDERANNATVALGASGFFSVRGFFPSGSARLIVDVVGWYE